MDCTQCGATVPDDARFCPACGHPVAGPVDQRRVVTVLFADIVGFTTLSETMDPERVKAMVDAWFQRLVGDITEFGGRVDKIVGDGILALFGAPVAHEDDAERAVRAALRMQETLATLAGPGRVVADGDEVRGRVQMRIGVNTGEVLVGALQAGGATTAMGDVVNTASRLQTAARPGQVLIGPTTHALTAHCIAAEPRGMLTARGREAPVEAWSATRVLSPPGHRPRRDLAPMVGRRRELALIDSAVGAAIGHSRALLGLIVGDTGVGKSRLVREAADRLDAGRDVLVLGGRCLPYGEANVWWPLAEALYGMCELEVTAHPDRVRAALWAATAAALGDDHADRELDRVAAGLRVLVGRDPDAAGRDPAHAREAAVDAFVAFVEGHARRRPVLLVLSDIHWADRDLLALIETLLVRLARSPVVIIATARQAVRDTWTPPVGRHDTFVLNLDPLETPAAAEMLDSLGDVPESLRDDLLARSGGNPFFLEELVALVEAEGAMPSASPGGPATGLPDTLRGIVTARLDGLSTDERALLTDAAVVGRRGPITALREMADKLHDGVDVDAVLEALVDAELIELDGSFWELRSEMAREVAYATLPKADRAKRHAGIAVWIETRLVDRLGLDLDAPDAVDMVTEADIDDASVSRVAHHWSAAVAVEDEMGELGTVPRRARSRAITWLTASARRAQRRDVLGAAERAYDRALALIDPSDGPGRGRLLVDRAHVRSDRWDLTGARTDAESALAEAAARGDRAIEASAVLRLGEVEQRSGDTQAATVRLRHAAERFAEAGDVAGEAEALRLLGMAHLFASDLPQAVEALEQAGRLYDTVADVAGQGWVAQNLAWAALMLGDLERTENEVEKALALFSSVDDEVGRSWARGLSAFVLFGQGRRLEAERIATEIIDAAEGHDDRWATATMRGLIGSIRLWEGQAAESVEITASAVQDFRELGDPWGLSIAQSNHGRALAMAGRVEDGFAALAEVTSVRSGRGRPDIGDLATAALSVQVGEPDRARAALARLAAGNTTAALGQTEPDATVLLAELQAGGLPEAPESRGRALGHVVAALVSAARGDLERALAEAAAVPGLPESTYLDRVLAEITTGLVMIRTGRSVEGGEHLDRAEAEAGATSDRVAAAVVAVARSVAAETAEQPDAPARRATASAALDALDLTARGWERTFARVVGRTTASVPG